MKNKLAIIIPAYKACFFREVLDSIVRQSNRDFTVYIGDDASPDDLESIVSDYKDKLDIFYFRFEQNWGGRDLVAHWERCIELSDEPLVWLPERHGLKYHPQFVSTLQVSLQSGSAVKMLSFISLVWSV